MLKKIIATFLIATALMFSGCGDEAGEDFLAAQNGIDEGNNGLAIALYGDIAPEKRTDSQNVLLANAYMSEAGFSTLDIITILGDDTSGEDPLTIFASVVTDANATLANIDLAILALEQVTVASEVATIEAVGDNELTLGLAYVVKVSILLADSGSDNAIIATTVNDAFNLILLVGNDDIDADVLAMRQDILDATLETEINAQAIADYRLTL